jgi:glycine dehydrogenase subunit 1
VDIGPSGRSVDDVRGALLERGIFGGLDLSRTMPSMGESLLVAVDETKTQTDLDRFVDAVAEVLA